MHIFETRGDIPSPSTCQPLVDRHLSEGTISVTSIKSITCPVISSTSIEIWQLSPFHFAAHEINADVITTGLGTGNMKSMADAVKTYNENNENDIDAVLGCKITHDDLTAAGYEIGETNYLYGNASTDHDRKIAAVW